MYSLDTCSISYLRPIDNFIDSVSESIFSLFMINLFIALM